MANPPEASAGRTTILVTGDIVVDHHIYIGELRAPTEAVTGKRATFEHVEFGGAALVESLLRTSSGKSKQPWDVEFGLLKDQRLYPHSFAIWEPYVAPGEDEGAPRVWLAREAGYGLPAAGRPVRDSAAPEWAEIVVVDEAGAGFRDRPDCWPKCLAGGAAGPIWLVWKMSGDLRGGALWRHVRGNADLVSRTILAVSASDLQRGGFEIAGGLSWERSALDVLRGLESTALAPLTVCAHLVVSFPDAGALWIDRTNPDPAKHVAKLVYRPFGGERVSIAPNRPKAFGYQACLTAGLVWCIASSPGSGLPDLTNGLRRGLDARFRLFETGHGMVDQKSPPAGFPADRIRNEALIPAPDPHTPFSDTKIPIGAGPEWTIVQQGITAPGPFYDTACTIALGGLSKCQGGRPDPLQSVPRLQVGGYVTIERHEIEAIRRLRRCVNEYVGHGREERPLSIAVFGAPGAGKSFIVKQLAKGFLGKNVPFIECNLSQFSDDRDLHGAFHLVRDAVLGGTTPVVFWDEFDSQEYRWLRLLLAPMQDGKFREGQVVHPIGKCIFIFAGSTSATFAEFGNPDVRAWRMSKGLDFRSRIHAHLDVLGPNPRMRMGRTGPEPDPTDACFPIRRALFLRGKWELDKHPEREFSERLVRGLLQVPEYLHGSRSFERVIVALAECDFPIGPESLPDAEELERDIAGVEEARRLLAFAHGKDEEDGKQERALIEERVDEFAARINAAYMEHPEKMRSSEVTLVYDNLSLFLKESNRAAVRRIWDVLSAAGLRIVKAGTPGALSREDGLALLDEHTEAAAMAEHEGWCEFHKGRGWESTSSQDDPKDTKSVPPRHPALVEWSVLNEDFREKDRHQVRVYGKIVYELGLALAAVQPDT